MKNKLLLACSLCTKLLYAQPNIDWQRNYGGSSGDGGTSIASTADGGYIVLGRTISNDGQVSGHHGLDDLWVINLDGDGELVWQRCLGGTLMEEPGVIRQVADGGYVLVGSTRSSDGDVDDLIGGSNIWVVRLDEVGGILWTNCYGGSDNDDGISILEMVDGRLLVLGNTNSTELSDYHGEQDLLLLLLGSDGSLLDQKCFGGSAQDGASDMLLLDDGSIVITGFAVSNDGDVSGNHGNSDGWVLKLEPDWTITWQRCLGGTHSDNARTLCNGPVQTYFIALATRSNDGDVSGTFGWDDFFIAHLDQNGELLNSSSYGGNDSEGPSSILYGQGTGLFTLGYSASTNGHVSSPLGDLDGWLINTDTSLNLAWDRSLGGSGSDRGRDMCFAHDGSLVVVGSSASIDGDLTGNYGGGDVWVVKFEAENVAVPEQDDAGVVVLYPSPANDAVRITWYKPDTHTLEVYDAQGRIVHTHTNLAPNQRDMVLSVAVWADGLYTVCLTGSSGRSARRFMKN